MTRYRHAAPTTRHPVRTLGVGLVAVSTALLTATGVYAGLSATATGAESVTAGALDLTLSPDVGAGFSNFAGAMAPGDTDNVYVTLKNTGSLASAAGMTLKVAGAPVNALTNGSIAGEGLSVALTQCSVAWTLATGTCSGTTTTLLASTAASTLGTATALSGVPALAATTGQVAHVRVSLTLAATETSTNGVAPGSSVQGLTTTLTYSFTEVQRTGTTTNQ